MVYPREANLSEQTEVQPFKIALTLLLKGKLADLEPLENIAISGFPTFLNHLPLSLT